MLLTVKSLGLAVGFSLSQMGIIISTLGGIFILAKENEKELIYVIVGCLLVILGGILLGYMKTV